jgi:uncharacterized protein YdeI (YjbR/CyaY-like superfamily)
MVKTENFQKLEIKTSQELRSWLETNHNQQEGIWLITYKKIKPEFYVSTSEVLDELLCFGWIDGIKRKLDDFRVMQLITPRRVQHWSKTYKVRYDILEKKGLVTQAGKQSVINSKKSGLWNFMDDVDNLIKPSDLIIALNQHPDAMANFDNFGSSSKRFMLRYIKIAKTEVTRKKRILEISILAKDNQKLPGS